MVEVCHRCFGKYGVPENGYLCCSRCREEQRLTRNIKRPEGAKNGLRDERLRRMKKRSGEYLIWATAQNVYPELRKSMESFLAYKGISQQLDDYLCLSEDEPDVDLTDDQIDALIEKAAEKALTKTDLTILKKARVFIRGTWQKSHKRFWMAKLPYGYDDQHLIHFVEVGTIRQNVVNALQTGESPLPYLKVLHDPHNTMLGPDWLNNRLGTKLKISADGTKVVPINGYTSDLAAKDGLNLDEYRLPIALNQRQLRYVSEVAA